MSKASDHVGGEAKGTITVDVNKWLQERVDGASGLKYPDATRLTQEREAAVARQDALRERYTGLREACSYRSPSPRKW